MVEDDDEIVIDLREIWGIIKTQRIFIIKITTLFLICAIGFCLLKKPEYESISVMRIPKDAWEVFTSRSVVEPAFEKYVGNDKLSNYDEWVKKNIKFASADISKDKKSKNDKETERPNILALTVLNESPEVAKNVNQAILDGGRRQYDELRIRKLDSSIEFAEQVLKRADNRVKEAMKLLQGTSGYATDSLAYSTIFNSISHAIDSQTKAIENLEKLRRGKQTLELSFELIDPPSLASQPLPMGRAKTCAVALILGVVVGCVSAIVKEKI